MTSKKIVEEALNHATKEEERHIDSANELETEDKEFEKEAKELKDMLHSFGKKI